MGEGGFQKCDNQCIKYRKKKRTKGGEGSKIPSFGVLNRCSLISACIQILPRNPRDSFQEFLRDVSHLSTLSSSSIFKTFCFWDSFKDYSQISHGFLLGILLDFFRVSFMDSFQNSYNTLEIYSSRILPLVRRQDFCRDSSRDSLRDYFKEFFTELQSFFHRFSRNAVRVSRWIIYEDSSKTFPKFLKEFILIVFRNGFEHFLHDF